MAKKKLYINNTWEIPMGRVMFMCVLNCFLSLGILLTSTDPVAGIVWLWGDMVASFRSKNNGNN